MAYQGYLVKVGTYKIPLKYIKADTYKVTNYGQDLDSYNSEDGALHRTALGLQAPKCEFETIPMYEDDLWNLLSNIKANYTNAIEKCANVEVYIPELHKYVTSKMYVPDIETSMYYADSSKILFNPTRIAFISYGVSTI